MKLDTTKLENLEELPDKWVARCPACAEDGHDNKGDHLVIYPNGKYGCVACQGDTEHRRRIWRLAGVGARGDQTPTRIRIPVREHPDRKRWLNRK